MSSATLRHHSITLSFLPYKRGHRLTKSVRSLRLRASRRRAKRVIREVIAQIKSYA